MSSAQPKRYTTEGWMYESSDGTYMHYEDHDAYKRATDALLTRVENALLHPWDKNEALAAIRKHRGEV